MAIPDFQTIMLPLLEVASDDQEHYIHDAADKLALYFKLTEEEKTKLLPSGQQPRFFNRVSWARTYLKKAGLIEYPKRGYFKITTRGKDVLENQPTKIDMKFLKQFPEYVEFKQATRKNNDDNEDSGDTANDLTPEEALEEAYQKIRDDLAADLLHYVVNSTPGFFEKLVVELLGLFGILHGKPHIWE